MIRSQRLYLYYTMPLGKRTLYIKRKRLVVAVFLVHSGFFYEFETIVLFDAFFMKSVIYFVRCQVDFDTLQPYYLFYRGAES